jgi:hypothetical protein
MKIKYLVALILTVSLASGCATDAQFKKGKKIVSASKLDLDNNGVQEIILAEDRLGGAIDILITITRPKPNNQEVVSFTVPGHFTKIEFIDLKGDGYKQMVVYYDDKDNKANLIIYSFKDEKLTKVFEISSPCGLDTDFSSVLGRVKAGKPKKGYLDCSSSNMTDWDVWVWAGDKFIKE